MVNQGASGRLAKAAKLFFKEISNTNKKNAGIIRISCTISLLLRKI